MELLNKAYLQLIAWLRAMTPVARGTLALSVVVVTAGIAYLARHEMIEQHTYLLGGEVFSTSQLSAMQSAFGKAGLEAHVDAGRIRIPQGQESKYMAALAETGSTPSAGCFFRPVTW